MKVSVALLAALLGTTLAASAQESTTPPPGTPTLTAPASDTAQAPTVSPAPAAPPTTATTPALPESAPVPAPASKPDPALDLMPAQPGQLLPPPVTPNPEPSLVPEVPQGALPPELNRSGKKTKTEQVEEEYAQRIRFRTAINKAQLDDKLQATWESAKVARTDFEKREILKGYYKALFARVRKIDPTVKKEADLREETYVRRLTPSRLAPTEEPTAADASERSTRGEISAGF